MQAKFLADQLTDQGIPAVSDMHDMHDALGSMSSGPRVWVRAEDLPRARPGSRSTTGSTRPSTAASNDLIRDHSNPRPIDRIGGLP